MDLPPDHTRPVIDRTPLAPMILALAEKIRAGGVSADKLNDIARCFTYHPNFTNITDREVLSAISSFESACTATFGSAPENVLLRFRKGSVQGGDLKHLFNLP